MKQKKPPKWLRRYAEKAADALGLHEYDLTFTGLGGEEPNSYADSDARYLRAEIALHAEVCRQETAEGRLTVVHELLHVAHAEQDTLTERVLAAYVPKRQRKEMRGMLVDANERYTERLARALAEVIR